MRRAVYINEFEIPSKLITNKNALDLIYLQFIFYKSVCYSRNIIHYILAMPHYITNRELYYFFLILTSISNCLYLVSITVLVIT